MIDLVEQFGATDLVVVTDRRNRTLARCDDPDRMAKLMEVLADLSEGWHVPPGGVPVAELRLNFRADDEPIGNLGVDLTFLTAHVHGTFMARDADRETAERLLRAVRAKRLVGEFLLDDD